jgi:hypothetical protein
MLAAHLTLLDLLSPEFFQSGLFSNSLSSRSTGEDPQHEMSNVLSGLLSFLQKCCYIWRPRKCLRLDVANLIILFRKMERKISLNFSKILCVCVFFSFFLETFRKFVEKIPPKKNKQTNTQN